MACLAADCFWRAEAGAYKDNGCPRAAAHVKTKRLSRGDGGAAFQVDAGGLGAVHAAQLDGQLTVDEDSHVVIAAEAEKALLPNWEVVAVTCPA